jgi:hypothetical protein
MARFELDRLFGQALTDARFFRQLQERPQEAVVQFQLTESEVRAVLEIAPAVSSVQDLAIQLDSWMTRDVSVVPVGTEERLISLDSSLQSSAASNDMALKLDQRGSSHSPKQPTPQITIRNGEQGICITLNQFIRRG